MDELLSVWRMFRPQRIAFNMFCCAFLLGIFGVMPRETISGFVGRHAASRFGSFGRSFARIAERFIDFLHPQEDSHCWQTYMEERDARIVLYPKNKEYW